MEDASPLLPEQSDGHFQSFRNDEQVQLQEDHLLVVCDGVRRGPGSDHGGIAGGRRDRESLRPHEVHDGAGADGPGDGGQGVVGDPAALFQPRGRARERRDRREPERHPQQPHAVHPAGGDRAPSLSERVRERLRHAGRHGRARLHPHLRPRAGPPEGHSVLVRHDEERNGGVQSGNGPRLLGAGDAARDGGSLRQDPALQDRAPQRGRHRRLLRRRLQGQARSGMGGREDTEGHVQRCHELADEASLRIR